MKMKNGQTIEEMYGPAMEITDQAEADAYFEKLVIYEMNYHNMRREGAERIQRENLGYYAGFYSAETRERVERLFKCEHPVFGKISEKGQPTPEEAYQTGLKLGKKLKRKGSV